MSEAPGDERAGTTGAPETRAGFVGVAGRPNVGKSTLINALVGRKVAIVSERPQTTRRAIRAIHTSGGRDRQLVLVDLPGVQRPRDSLTRRMQARVEQELAGSDVVLLVVNGEQGIGPGDRFIASVLLGSRAASSEAPAVVVAVNKRDRLSRRQEVEALVAAARLEGTDEVFPVSARTGDGVEELRRRLTELVPPGPLLYPPEELSDQAPDVQLAELVREQILRRTRHEVPHAIEVRIEEVAPRDDGIIEVTGEIWVETPSQRGIVIGAGGKMIRAIGTAARAELERELGGQVFLDLRVRVRDSWRRDDSLLDRLGIE